MPSPREQPPSPGNRRRRQEVMPGGWLWLLILMLLVGVLYFTMGFGNAGQIQISDFMKLVEDHQVSRVLIMGSNRIVGELKDNAKVPADLEKQIRGNRIAATLPE